VSKSKHHRDRVPPKNRKLAICEQTFTGGEGIVKEGVGSVALRGVELLTIPPALIVMGAAVFMIGVLTGAGIAAWMMPPV
jgi:hypothetical protein